MDIRLAILRMNLFGAMQTLKDEDLEEFWALIDEVNMCRNPIKSREEIDSIVDQANKEET